jgi:uncharacterized lipoprotein YddW (UPF0748 family)
MGAMRRSRLVALLASLVFATPSPALSQMAGPYAPALPDEIDAPPVPREFRGVWIATVDNIDWPSRAGLPVDSAKGELFALLDRAVARRLNAVIVQVRTAADAL